MAFNAPIRHRSFDPATRKLASNTRIFAGRSSAQDSTTYPGDDKIVGGDDTITIQLYHVHLDGAEMDYAQEAYTLAVYYPERLAASYYSNEKYNIDDQDEEEDEE